MVFWPHAFSRAWRQFHVFASNSDWLVVLFTSVAIGQSNYFGFGPATLNWKPLYSLQMPHSEVEEDKQIYLSLYQNTIPC